MPQSVYLIACQEFCCASLNPFALAKKWFTQPSGGPVDRIEEVRPWTPTVTVNLGLLNEALTKSLKHNEDNVEKEEDDSVSEFVDEILHVDDYGW